MKVKLGIVGMGMLVGVLVLWLFCGRSAAVEAVYPVENGVTWFSRAVVPLSGLFSGVRVAAENERLRRELAAMGMVRLEADLLARENQRLRELLGRGDEAMFVSNRWICAPVLSGSGADGVRGLLRVKGGWLDGVATNATVAVPQGLVGRVVEVTPHTATVRLITHPAMRVSCEIEMGDPDWGRVHGILVGGGARAVRAEAGARLLYVVNPLRIRHLNREPPVVSRAKILTSGLGGVFPRGLPVGFLGEDPHEDESQLEREGDVIPAVDFPSLEDVFIRREN